MKAHSGEAKGEVVRIDRRARKLQTLVPGIAEIAENVPDATQWPLGIDLGNLALRSREQSGATCTVPLK